MLLLHCIGALAFFYDAFAPLGGHLLNIIFIEISLLGHLLIGTIQSHKISTQNPHT